MNKEALEATIRECVISITTLNTRLIGNVEPLQTALAIKAMSKTLKELMFLWDLLDSREK